MGGCSRTLRSGKLFKLSCLCMLIYFIGKQITFTNKRPAERPVQSGVVSRDIHPHLASLGTQNNNNRKDGFLKASILSSMCQRIPSSSTYKSRNRVRVDYSAAENAVFCPMCKMASTFWTRVFRMIDFNQKLLLNPKYKTPFDVPISKAPSSKAYYNPFDKRTNRNIDSSESFKFLFVRNPYAMLFSAYTDKIIKPTIIYFNAFGKPAVSRLRKIPSNGNDITFPEFVDEVVYQYRKSGNLDCHVQKFDTCRPCSIDYSFVGTLETFKQDTMDVLSVMHQQKTIDIFTKDFSVLHADDAIEDATNGVFAQRKELPKFMTWSDAVKRIWRNLQIRGILGLNGFPLTNEQAEAISQDELIKLLKMTFRNTTSEDRKKIKKQAYLEAYRGVSVELLHEVREVYKEDFMLFQYNDAPAELFDRSRKLEVYGLMDYSNIEADLKPLGIYV